MRPQYVADHLSPCGQNDALESQNSRLRVKPYQMKGDWTMVPSRNTQVSLTSEPGRARHFAAQRPLDRNRRHRCPRASNSLQRSALSPQSQHVQAASPTKNTWWLSQNPSRLSQHTQVSTSKPDTGQAFAPALTSPVLLIARLSVGSTLNIGGA